MDKYYEKMGAGSEKFQFLLILTKYGGKKMKALRLFLMVGLIFTLGLSGHSISGDEVLPPPEVLPPYPVEPIYWSYNIWINPAYKDVAADKVPKLLGKTVSDTETVYVNSYAGFKSACLDKLRNRIMQVSIYVSGFSVDKVGVFWNRFFKEIESEEPYTFYNIYKISGSIGGSDGNVTISCTLTYWTTTAQEQYVSQRVAQILGDIITFGMNDEQKVKVIHDWVVKNVQYDLSKSKYSAYEALYSETTVCQGYALLTFRMLKDSGITARIVIGETSGGSHAWNMIYLCGWYHLDTTWDDPVPDVPNRILYNYFNKSDSYMEADHTWTRADYPVAPIAYVEGVCQNTQITYVNKNAIGGNNGTSWTDAYTDLQTALNTAVSGDEIWVAKGLYKPTLGTDRTISFHMKNGVKIYGGFAGDETALSQRNWQANKTILSGDIDDNDTVDSTAITTVIKGSNSYHIIDNGYNGDSVDHTAVMDGFIITGGQAGPYGVSSPSNGGGMLNIFSNPTITRCSFSGNSATYGGGIYNDAESNPTITNCLFSNNSALDGGGIYNWISSPTITACSFSNNLANNGGGIYNVAERPKITNCLFSNNSASKGAEIYNHSSSPTITACSFSNNSANSGGGIYNVGSSPRITNSILWNSSEIVNYDYSNPEVYYSTVKGGWTGIGSNNKNLDPLFVNAAAGDLRLQSGSPAINAGNNSYIPVGVITDLYGNPRITDGTADMGAYESASVDLNGDGVVDIRDLNIIKANLNKSATACPKCDLDNDGKISVLDAKKLMNMCNCPNCICP
jgi:hypothetical protein